MSKQSKIALLAGVLSAVVLLPLSVFSEQDGLPPPQPVTEPPAMFQPVALDRDLVRKSMQARTELDRLNRAINKRQTEIYEENPAIKEMQAEMRKLQAKIDAVLDADAELQELKAQEQEVAPEMPFGAIQPPAHLQPAK